MPLNMLSLLWWVCVCVFGGVIPHAPRAVVRGVPA